MGEDFRVTITNPVRREEWLMAIGTETIYVKSPIPHYATIPGRPGPELVFDLDLAMLSADQRDSLGKFLAQKFGSPLEEVRAAMSDAEYNLPILDHDCVVSIHNPQRWLG